MGSACGVKPEISSKIKRVEYGLLTSSIERSVNMARVVFEVEMGVSLLRIALDLDTCQAFLLLPNPFVARGVARYSNTNGRCFVDGSTFSAW